MLQSRAVSYPSRVPVPEVLRSTMLRRFRSLERDQRAIVMRVSAIGRDFDFRIAVAAAGCAEATVRCALERARGLQILVALEADRYSFRHALTREIVYGELLSGQVRPLHRRNCKNARGGVRIRRTGAGSVGLSRLDRRLHAPRHTLQRTSRRQCCCPPCVQGCAQLLQPREKPYRDRLVRILALD